MIEYLVIMMAGFFLLGVGWIWVVQTICSDRRKKRDVFRRTTMESIPSLPLVEPEIIRRQRRILQEMLQKDDTTAVRSRTETIPSLPLVEPEIIRRQRRILQEMLQKDDTTAIPSRTESSVTTGHRVNSVQEFVSDGKGEPCMVCRHPIVEGSLMLVCPHCQGQAHKDHLLDWLETHVICPICRQKLR